MNRLYPPPRIRRFARNTQGRDLAVGDIHGAFSKLNAALQQIDFNAASGDRLFCNHEEMAIQYASPYRTLQLHTVYSAHGGRWNIERAREEQDATAADFLQLPIAIEVETSCGSVGIVHADVPFMYWDDLTNTLEHEKGDRLDRVIQSCLWSRSRHDSANDDGVRGIKAVLVGHTVVPELQELGNVIFIDTGGWKGVEGGAHEFTIFNLETLQVEPRRQ